MNKESKIVVSYSAEAVGVRDIIVSTHTKTARGMYNALKSASHAKEQAIKDKGNRCGAVAYVDVDGVSLEISSLGIEINHKNGQVEDFGERLTVSAASATLKRWDQL